MKLRLPKKLMEKMANMLTRKLVLRQEGTGLVVVRSVHLKAGDEISAEVHFEDGTVWMGIAAIGKSLKFTLSITERELEKLRRGGDYRRIGP